MNQRLTYLYVESDNKPTNNGDIMVESQIKMHKHIHMNFTKIIRTAVTDNNYENLFRDFEHLQEYEKGTSESPSEGFKDENIELEDFDLYNLQEYGTINPVHMSNQSSVNAENILKKSFYIEEYPRNSTDPILSRVDIFWILPCNLLLMNGGHDAAKKAFKNIKPILKTGFKEIELEHDFLVWITCRLLRCGGKLKTDDESLIIRRIDKGNTKNLEKGTSRVPRDISVKHGIQAELSLPTIYGLVNQHEFASIGGEFSYRKDTINAQLSAKKGIHVYAQAALKGKEYEERCNIALPFIIDIINVFDIWEKLDNKMKYPDKKYMDKMNKSLKEQIEECEENFKQLQEYYLNLRGEE